MANNRMVLVCKRCKVGVRIAKFYPMEIAEEAGWCSWNDNAKDMHEFFLRHAHDYDDSAEGGNQYEMRYESDGGFDYEHIVEYLRKQGN